MVDVIPGIVVKLGEDEEEATCALLKDGESYKYKIPVDLLEKIGADEVWSCFVILNRDELANISSCSKEVMDSCEDECNLFVSRNANEIH